MSLNSRMPLLRFTPSPRVPWLLVFWVIPASFIGKLTREGQVGHQYLSCQKSKVEKKLTSPLPISMTFKVKYNSIFLNECQGKSAYLT